MGALDEEIAVAGASLLVSREEGREGGRAVVEHGGEGGRGGGELGGREKEGMTLTFIRSTKH